MPEREEELTGAHKNRFHQKFLDCHLFATTSVAVLVPISSALAELNQKVRLVSTEAARRRTFAIISHPDAGKTTLTEKLLLMGGAIQLAGEVKARKGGAQTRSDWMGIERERGIYCL